MVSKAEVQPEMSKDELLASYGMYQSSGSTNLQKKADSILAQEREREANTVSNYERLVSTVGIENIGRSGTRPSRQGRGDAAGCEEVVLTPLFMDRLERGLVVGSSVFLAVIILSGIGIGIEAFLKSTGRMSCALLTALPRGEIGRHFLCPRPRMLKHTLNVDSPLCAVPSTCRHSSS